MASELSSMSFRYAMEDTAFTDDSVDSNARVDMTWQADEVDTFDGDYSYGDTAERTYADMSPSYDAGPESDESDDQQEGGRDSHLSSSGQEQDQGDDHSPGHNLNVTAAVAKRLTPAERAKLTRQERKTPWQRAFDMGLDLDDLWLQSLKRLEKTYDLEPAKGWREEVDNKVKKLTTTGTAFGGRKFNPGNMDWLTYFVNDIWDKGLSALIQDKFHLNHNHVLDSLRRHNVFPSNTVSAYEIRTRAIMQKKMPIDRLSEFISGCDEFGLRPMWERSPAVWKQVLINRTHITNPDKTIQESHSVTLFGLIIQSAFQYYDTTPTFNEWEEKCHNQGVSKLFPRINIRNPEKFCAREDGARELFALIDQQKSFWTHAVGAAPIEKIYYSCWFLDSALLAKIKAQFGDQSWQSASGETTADEADWIAFKSYVSDLHADLFQEHKGLCGSSSSTTYVARLKAMTRVTDSASGALSGFTSRMQSPWAKESRQHMLNRTATDRFDSHTNAISETAYKDRLKNPWLGQSAKPGSQKNQLRLMADEGIKICDESGFVIETVTEGLVLRRLRTDHQVEGWDGLRTLCLRRAQAPAKLSNTAPEKKKPEKQTDWQYPGLTLMKAVMLPDGSPNVEAVRKHLHAYLTKETRNDAWTGLTDANVKALLKCQPCNVKALPSQTAAITTARCSICEKTAWGMKLAPKLQPQGPRSKSMPPVLNWHTHSATTCKLADFRTIYGDRLAALVSGFNQHLILDHLYGMARKRNGKNSKRDDALTRQYNLYNDKHPTRATADNLRQEPTKNDFGS